MKLPGRMVLRGREKSNKRTNNNNKQQKSINKRQPRPYLIKYPQRFLKLQIAVRWKEFFDKKMYGRSARRSKAGDHITGEAVRRGSPVLNFICLLTPLAPTKIREGNFNLKKTAFIKKIIIT